MYARTPLPAALPLVVAALLAIAAAPLGAQRLTTKGTDFWLGFMLNFQQRGAPNTLTIHITSDRATSGTVTVPGIGFSQTFSVPANGRARIQVPEAVLIAGSDVEAKLGIHVAADDSVSVYAMNHQPATADATVVLPTPSLGGEYMVVAYSSPGEETLYPAEMLIVGVHDGTIVEITPSVTTGGGKPAGLPYTIQLDAGDIYQIEAAGDLTGTTVRDVSPGGCGRFALFGGATRATVGGCGYADHLLEQIFPLAAWGRSFPVVPLLTKKGDLFRVVAAQNGTRVTIDGGPVIMLDAGRYVDTLLTDPHMITADQPIAVAQFCRGTDCDGVADSDPDMLLLSPFEQSIESIVFDAFATPTTTHHYLNVVTRTDATGRVMLDGTAIGASFAPILADPSLSYARIGISGGSHTLVGDGGLLASVYAFGRAESYSYAAGVRIDVLPPSISVSSTAAPIGQDTFCAGERLVLKGMGDATVKGWRWRIDPTGELTGREVTIAAAVPGAYRVTVFADRNPGCADEIDSATTTLTILPAPSPTILPLTSLSLCAIDSVRLTADQGYRSYRWSNGATTRDLAVAEPGSYTLTVTNDAGCKATSPPVTVTGSIPEAPTITESCECEGKVLTAPAGYDGYRWSTGETTRSIVVRRSDLYQVTGIMKDGCERTSIPFAAEPAPGGEEEMTIEPRTVEAAPGDTMSFTITTPRTASAGVCVRTHLTFTIGFDASLLALDSVTRATVTVDTAIDSRRLVTLTTTDYAPITLHMTAALGAAESTPVELVAFGWNECLPPASGRELAAFRLSAICREGGTRLFDAGEDSLLLKPSRPDPASSVARIEYGVIERGRTELVVIDVSGRRVARLVDADLEPGRYLAAFDVSRLPSGVYSYILRTPTAQLQRRLRVVK